ncbi:Two component regulator three Y domain protein [Phytophthora cinnamomi]|uniref:Two component regulator three Y domain protein n=1 Tax=Phytophthora cinnamomi TaxID=4785 RepID=UPI00355A85E0|nr:Two component regulator three Y domain protein [Phytophthora cinnamomi]
MAITRNERGALKLLYWATHGQRWAAQWDIQNENSDPCLDSWYGIVCDRYGRIRSIRLANNNLVGVLPPEFPRKDLSGLQELDLSSNFLTGYVPDTVSTLTALRTLRLDRNYFIGPVPASIAELTMLEFLEIQENNFDPVNAYGGVLPDAVQQLTDPEGQHCHIIF